MSIRVSIVSVGVVCALLGGSGCNIETCEEGAVCGDDSQKANGEDKQCAVYCARVTICDPNAVEFNDCVDTCESGFETDPEATAQLCACAEWSTCSDIVGGHCSAKPNGSGGSSGSGGSATGGTSAGGTSAGGTSAGGTSAGGTSAGGTSAGGTSAGGTSAGGAGGSGATDAGTACAHDCDCPLGENCVSGYCAPSRS